jgi:poly-gamma-glutamate system protein
VNVAKAIAWLGAGSRNWTEPRVPISRLAVGAVISIALWQTAEQTLGFGPHPKYEIMLAAAEKTLRAQREIARVKQELGILQSADIDPNRTGLIGPDWSEITTTIGDLQAKRTVTNPDLAAILVGILAKLQPKEGAAVGLLLSGSFVGANVAAISAVEALGLRPVIISSLGASMYGATDPEFTWLDMEGAAARAGIWRSRSAAVALGGESAIGGGLSGNGRALLIAAARRNGYEPLDATDFTELMGKARAVLAASASTEVVALLNSGGSVLAMGTCLDSYRLPAGLLVGKLPCNGGVPGLIHDFAGRNVPVVHILNVKRLALDWGLPFDPLPLPSVGKNARVYGKAAPIRGH